MATGNLDRISGMHAGLTRVIAGMDLLYEGLVMNRAEPVERAALMLDAVMREAIDTCNSTGKGAIDEDLALAALSGHVGAMAENLIRLGRELYERHKLEILFSERAIAELEHMFELARDILINAREMTLNPHVLTARHLDEADETIEHLANEYATRHEERLIEGLCMARASALFIPMLEAFKRCASHAARLGRELSHIKPQPVLSGQSGSDTTS